MQDHDGSFNCNTGTEGDWTQMVNPCPADKINGMVQDGVGGTSAGAGLAELLNNAINEGNALRALNMNADNAQVFYQAARKYNSGRVDDNNLNNGFQSTHCYVMDIANRLTGWVSADRSCTPNS